VQPTTAKKKLLEPVMTLSEAEAEAEALRPLDARQDETEGQVGQPVEGAERSSGPSIPSGVIARPL
jgi:hypothetical protein